MADRGSGWWPQDEGEGEEPEHGATGDGSGDESPGAPSPPPHRPPRGLESRDRPKVASRYSLYVGLAFIALAVVAVLNAVRTEEGGIAGADRTANQGLALPEFAAPDVLSGVTGDANIDQDDCETARNPCPADQVHPPACEVETEGAIRVCDFFDKPLAISFWFTRGGDCTPTQDAFDRVADDRGDQANFLSVNVLDERESIEGIVRQRGWEVPVAHDADGAVSNIFGVGVCPTIFYVYPGGIQHAADIAPGNMGEGQIDAALDDLLEASAARERGRAGGGDS